MHAIRRSVAPSTALTQSAASSLTKMVSAGAGVEEGGDVPRIALADVEVGHRGARRHRLRIADPVLEIVGLVLELSGDDRPHRDSVERRADRAAGHADMLEP